VLLGVGLAKLVATGVSVGLGMPSSIIGPTLVTGATLGGALGLVGAALMPEQASTVGFYAMLGMGAMMGAVLQAPLAALMALLEFTHNPHIIMPGMLAITVASLVTSEVFGKKAVFQSMLKAQGLGYDTSPVTQALRRVGVGAIMERSVKVAPRVLEGDAIAGLLTAGTRWVLVEGSKGPVSLLLTADLARFVEQRESEAQERGEPAAVEAAVDLMAIPAKRQDVSAVSYQATLEEALQTFERTGAEVLYVRQYLSYGIVRIAGVLHRADIDSYYQAGVVRV
jgi:CIC family chloride channel protein